MALLEEVLLVQFVHKYGTADYAQIAEKLQKHPLLTSASSRKSTWTAIECQTMLNDLTTRESTALQSFSVQDRLALASLLRTLHARCLDELKQSIKADEAEYDSLKAKQSELSSTTMEIPSSTQDTAKDAHASHDANEDKTTSDADHALENEEEDEDVALSDVDVEDEKVDQVEDEAEREDNIEEEQREDEEQENAIDEDEEMDEMPPNEEAKNETTESPVNNDETPKKRRNKKKEPNTPEDIVDEIATNFHNGSADTPEETVKSEEVKEAGGVTTRGGRTRSNTMNTVASTDTAINDDYAADQSLKKKGTRTSKRGTLRDDARSPTASSTAEDADNAAMLKRFQSTILPVLNNIASHRYASIFSNPVSNKEAPNYSNVVKSPLDIKTIRAQVKSGDLPNMQSFERALTLMLANAIMYNAEHSEVAKMARDVYEHALVNTTSCSSSLLLTCSGSACYVSCC